MATGRGSYSKQLQCYLTHAVLPYVAWAEGDWQTRAGLVASALTAAVARLPKTRFSEHERATLREAAATAAEHVTRQAPPMVEPVESVMVHAGDDGPAIYFGGGAPSDAVEVLPSDAASVRVSKVELASERTMFKLYRRLGAAIEYREAWIGERAVVEHWGVCGERGEVRHHPVSSKEEASQTLRAVRAASEAGFRPLAPSRHKTLAVEFAVSESDLAALDRRHALEDFLNEEIGWIGLGHCDGGSIGGGAMEVLCRVVDYELAVRVLTPILRASPFADFSRIYQLV
jgi:hypothetical protein